MNFNRRRYIRKLECKYEDGELTEEELIEMLARWDEGYDAEQERRWEMENDR